MAELERIYTIPLREAYEHTRRFRTRRAVKELKKFLAKHMKIAIEKVKLSEALNKHLWSMGMKKCPRRVKVKVREEKGFVKAYLFAEKEGKKKKQRKPVKPAEGTPTEKRGKEK